MIINKLTGISKKGNAMKAGYTMFCAAMMLAGSCCSHAAGTDTAVLPEHGQTIVRSDTQDRFKGADTFFTGDVQITMQFQPTAELPASGAYVTFQKGARTAWHTHPAGQTLLVVSGKGLTQEWGKPLVVIEAGDVVRCPAGVKHWHGAAPDSTMTHLAITGERDGKNVEWLEKVNDRQYAGH